MAAPERYSFQIGPWIDESGIKGTPSSSFEVQVPSKKGIFKSPLNFGAPLIFYIPLAFISFL